MEKCDCLEGIFASFGGKREELIPILQRVQEEFGYLPENAMFEIARFARVPESAVYAVATFYAQFRFTPIGKNHIMVCRGTACHVRGAPRILEKLQKQLGIDEGETTEDGEFSLETVACIGACGLSPCITINKQVEAKMTPKRVTELLRTESDNGD
jgi:NADH-quinone oxidoreductase subunit E